MRKTQAHANAGHTPRKTVVQVPVDRFLQALLPRRALSPAKCIQLVVADVVPAVIERPVLHVHDLLLWHLEDLGNVMCHIDHLRE